MAMELIVAAGRATNAVNWLTSVLVGGRGVGAGFAVAPASSVLVACPGVVARKTTASEIAIVVKETVITWKLRFCIIAIPWSSYWWWKKMGGVAGRPLSEFTAEGTSASADVPVFYR